MLSRRRSGEQVLQRLRRLQRHDPELALTGERKGDRRMLVRSRRQEGDGLLGRDQRAVEPPRFGLELRRQIAGVAQELDAQR